MQFVYPIFLWGLFAVAIPIAIHLLQLRRPQRVLFTNTSFIREVELTTMRRRRLQELVVLALRVLAIAALVLLFVQPYWTPQQVARPGGEVAVLVDTSPSMQATGANGHLLLRDAIDQGQFLGKSYGLTTRFHVVGQGSAPLTQVAYTSKLTTLAGAAKLVGWDAAAGRQEMQRKQVGPLYVFSDFQRSGQRSAFLQKIPADREVVLVPLVAPAAANVYADSVWLDDAFIRPQTNMALHIQLRNGGGTAITDCPVKVKLGGRQVAAFRTSLAAGQMATTVVQVQVPDGQLARGEVLTEDASVTFDNAFYFTLQPTSTIRVLEIGEEPVARQAYQAEPLFAYSFAKAGQVNYGELRQANLVLLQGTVADAGLRQALASVVQRGGSVAVVPPASPAGYEATSQLLRTLGVGGAQWETAGVPARQEVAMPTPRDPFFWDVFGAQPRQVTMPQVAPVLRLPGNGRAVLKLRDGDGYLLEFGGTGAGHTYVFTAPFAKAYGDFTAQALFVPVLYRMALLSYHTDQLPAYRLNAPTLALTVPASPNNATSDAAQFQLVHDSLKLIPVQRLRGATLQLELPATMSQPGFYELQQRGKPLTVLAFNADRQESELATYSAAELRQLVGPGHPNVQVLDGGVGATALASYRAGQTGQPLWRYCLLAALACLLAEALVLRFGRTRVGRQSVAVA